MDGNQLMFWIGVVSAVSAPILSLYGIYRANQVDKAKIKNEQIATKASADETEARIKKITLEAMLSQSQYYSVLVDELRKEIEERGEEINRLNEKVDAQEVELNILRKKVFTLTSNNEYNDKDVTNLH